MEQTQGWKNWDTWNIALQVANDSVLWKLSHTAKNENELKETICTYFELVDNGYFTKYGIDTERVDWKEIFDDAL